MNTDKITTLHKERTAIVYVRQSTTTQVLHSLESQKRQYALKDYAATLGFSLVDLIDDDLGRSGSGLVQRPGFARLLERICLGEVARCWRWKPRVWRGTTATGITSSICAR